MFDVLVFIGRFQPFHKGHEALLKKALDAAKHIIIVCGSARQARSLHNPWFVEEREHMIRHCFLPEENKRMTVTSTIDVSDDALWIKNTIEAVKEALPTSSSSLKIGLIGHIKDDSCYYLTLFPCWKSFYMERQSDIDATAIRALLFNPPFAYTPLAAYIPQAVQDYLEDFKRTPDFISLCESARHIIT